MNLGLFKDLLVSAHSKILSRVFLLEQLCLGSSIFYFQQVINSSLLRHSSREFFQLKRKLLAYCHYIYDGTLGMVYSHMVRHELPTFLVIC